MTADGSYVTTRGHSASLFDLMMALRG